MIKMRTLGAIASVFVMTSVVSPAFAKQCIWNKAGFIMNISWIQNDNVIRRDRIALGQGNCSVDNGVDYQVVLSIQGGKLASDFSKFFVSAAGAALGLVEGPGGVVGGLAMAELGSRIPDVQEIFYVGVPSSDRYLDVWGTVWSPQTGPGGSIQH
jgi:hypothetical protein